MTEASSKNTFAIPSVNGPEVLVKTEPSKNKPTMNKDTGKEAQGDPNQERLTGDALGRHQLEG